MPFDQKNRALLSMQFFVERRINHEAGAHLIGLHGSAEVWFGWPFDTAVQGELTDAQDLALNVHNVPFPVGPAIRIREEA
jgi:hypothetical protein